MGRSTLQILPSVFLAIEVFELMSGFYQGFRAWGTLNSEQWDSWEVWCCKAKPGLQGILELGCLKVSQTYKSIYRLDTGEIYIYIYIFREHKMETTI